ncbi:hypothetical protein GUITHDRAFT_104346 [Guillardia theta CCMP2712]|uniref:RWP-RK domain-containing protein n=1 Tax=Guillardia theta (strain CCMP2712) TaxID=905079 RepID=L1JMY2_GUITC|nr:hypothetical protein GUITHDRAFT_104346 [Guillardia theta CCMP2712]EKX49951.1 hypothetical protein GUITHDRAFT_104346 [Guillardia theta CCMP2712]|eukprot:XP_005836931.1 hypothetical protein GUITHDRAFT_104346 [Guillardia theta CCMP2712]
MAEQVVTVKARIGTGKKMRIKNVELDLSKIKSLFHLRQEEAAKTLCVSLTSLKVACRRLGINRWPYERVFTSSASNAQPSSSKPQDSSGEGPQRAEAQSLMRSTSEMGDSFTMDSCPSSSYCSPQEELEEREEASSMLEEEGKEEEEEVEVGPCSVPSQLVTNPTCTTAIDSEWLDWYISCNDDNLIFPDCHVLL